MENVNWGVPTQRTKKVERFSEPVLTMHSLEGKGSGRKFSFNKAAITALSLDPEKEQNALIGFNGQEVFVKISEGEHPHNLRITKQASFSNKKTFEYIASLKEINVDAENNFFLVEVAEGTFRLDLIVEEGTDMQDETAEVEEVEEEVKAKAEVEAEVLGGEVEENATSTEEAEWE
jgi:hypothetical protein